ncbi:MAG TPA: hypothetical protein VGM95_00090 [Lactobacillaceae bacterium]|jgi:hypothetical protein
MPYPQEEQETIVIYDRKKKQWHLDITTPVHMRKYAKYLDDTEENSEDRLAGWVDPEKYSVSFSIRERKRLSESERARRAENLRRNVT